MLPRCDAAPLDTNNRDAARTKLIALVEAAQDGDEPAWSQLHAEFTPTLRRVAAQYRLCEADLVDVVQATWAKCFEQLARLRDAAALPAWLTTICRREALRVLQTRAKCVPVDCDGHGSLTAMDTSTAGDPCAALEHTETCTLLRMLLDELGPRDRKLIGTLVEGDLAYRQIAEQLGMPIGSIGPTRQRIITKLRQRAQLLELAA